MLIKLIFIWVIYVIFAELVPDKKQMEGDSGAIICASR